MDWRVDELNVTYCQIECWGVHGEVSRMDCLMDGLSVCWRGG